MRISHGIELSESCASCKFRRDGFFCQLSPAELKDFSAIKHVLAYPKGAVIFAREQNPSGLYVLCEGEVKLSVGSLDGNTLILRIVTPGDVLGLWSAMSGAPYEASAECLRPCQVAFVSRVDFMEYLRQRPAVLERTAIWLGRQYRISCKNLSAVVLGGSVPEKVAQFLLERSLEAGAKKNGAPFPLSLSHEEIAEFIGATRESVTRAFSELRKSGLVEQRGDAYLILDRVELAAFRSHPNPTRNSGLKPRLVRPTRAVRQQRSEAVRWREPERPANARKRA